MKQSRADNAPSFQYHLFVDHAAVRGIRPVGLSANLQRISLILSMPREEIFRHAGNR